MTLARWLDERRPAPPRALRERIDAALNAGRELESHDVADRCLAAGERLVRALLEEGATSRDAALDLLAADALVTYAFEAASDEPERLGERATAAMRRIAALASAPAGERVDRATTR